MGGPTGDPLVNVTSYVEKGIKSEIEVAIILVQIMEVNHARVLLRTLKLARYKIVQVFLLFAIGDILMFILII